MFSFMTKCGGQVFVFLLCFRKHDSIVDTLLFFWVKQDDDRNKTFLDFFHSCNIV